MVYLCACLQLPTGRAVECHPVFAVLTLRNGYNRKAHTVQRTLEQTYERPTPGWQVTQQGWVRATFAQVCALCLGIRAWGFSNLSLPPTLPAGPQQARRQCPCLQTLVLASRWPCALPATTQSGAHGSLLPAALTDHQGSTCKQAWGRQQAQHEPGAVEVAQAPKTFRRTQKSAISRTDRPSGLHLGQYTCAAAAAKRILIMRCACDHLDLSAFACCLPVCSLLLMSPRLAG